MNGNTGSHHKKNHANTTTQIVYHLSLIYRGGYLKVLYSESKGFIPSEVLMVKDRWGTYQGLSKWGAVTKLARARRIVSKRVHLKCCRIL